MSLSSNTVASNGHICDLLRLPLEVRRLIYGYLIPNVKLNPLSFVPGPNRPTATKFRHDEQICHPVILRINKQMHREAMEEFYGHAGYYLTVYLARSKIEYRFLRAMYPFDEDPPVLFPHVKHLTMIIRIERVLSAEKADQMTQLIRTLFISSRNRLEDLHLDVVWSAMTHLGQPNNEFRDALLEHEDMTGRALDSQLGAFKDVRGIPLVTFRDRSFFRATIRPRNQMDDDLMWRIARIDRESKRYLQELVRLMMLPAT